MSKKDDMKKFMDLVEETDALATPETMRWAAAGDRALKAIDCLECRKIFAAHVISCVYQSVTKSLDAANVMTLLLAYCGAVNCNAHVCEKADEPLH